MLVILSPAKSLDFSNPDDSLPNSNPVFEEEAGVLAGVLKKYSARRLATLMKINPKLAQLNFERFQEFSLEEGNQHNKHALLSFRGDVYLGIDAPSLGKTDLLFAQDHVRILSGLYGSLKPLDRIQAYRLEMGSALKFRRHKNLYQFWGNKVADVIQKEAAEKGGVIINLASQEYFKVLKGNLDDLDIITPTFKDFKNGEYKFIHVFGKKARGLMTRFIIDKKITNPEEIKLFDYEGYYYNDRLSEGNEWVFTRG